MPCRMQMPWYSQRHFSPIGVKPGWGLSPIKPDAHDTEISVVEIAHSDA